MSFAMQEPEPLRLRREYGPTPAGRTSLPSLEAKAGGKKPALDHEGRKRIAMEPGKAPEVAAKHGLSKSCVFAYRREFRAERDAAGLSGNAPVYEYEDRRRIALMEGPSQRAIAKQFGISPATVWAYQREFRKERIAAGLEKRSTGEAVRAASSPSEVVAGGTPVDEPLAGVVAGQGHEIQDWLL